MSDSQLLEIVDEMLDKWPREFASKIEWDFYRESMMSVFAI